LLERARFGDRYIGVVLDKWDFETGKNVVLEIDRYIDECRFIALVVTKAFLGAEWPTLERTIAVGSDPSGRAGKVLVLLKENVQLPPSLRMRIWIDFHCCPAKLFRRRISHAESVVCGEIGIFRFESFFRGLGAFGAL